MSIIWINNTDYVELAAEGDTAKPGLEAVATLERHPTIQTSESLLPNPDPVLIKEGLRMDVFESLENDEQVGTCIDSRKLAVLGLDEAIEQGSASDEAYNLINNLYADSLNTEDINDSMLDFRYYGNRVMELLWTINSNGYLVPGDIVARDHEFFRFNKDGRLMFITKDNKQGVDAMTTYPNSFLLLRNRPSPKNPYGKALLSSVFWSVAFKRGGMKWWSLFMEKFGIPKVLIKHPRNMDKNKITDMVMTAAKTILDGVLAVPEGSDVTILETNVTGAGDAHDKYISKQDAYIAKRILGHAGNADSTPGRLGNDDNATDVFAARTKSDMRFIIAKHNEVIRRIIDLNFGKDAPAPRYKLYAEQSTDLLQLADIHNKIYALGYDISEPRLRNDFGYDEGDLIKRSVEQQGSEQPVALASGNAGDAANGIVESSSKKMNTGVEQLIEAIQQATEKSPDAEKLKEKLIAMIGNTELMQGFEDAMTAAQVFAIAAGSIDAIESGE